jgi:DNA-directed RNA polymerase specialized sigma24 family protein
MEALAEVAAAHARTVWCLARTGFSTEVDGKNVHVRGVESIDRAEHLTVRILARSLAPDRRRLATDEGSIRRLVVEDARSELLEAASRSGSLVTFASDDQPPGASPIEALVESEPTEPDDPAGAIERFDAMLATAGATTEGLDDRCRDLIRRRWRDARPVPEIARELDRGTAAVRSLERRVRKAIAHAIRKAHGETPGSATIDAILSGARGLSAVTLERIRRSVLARTFQEEPRPYRERLLWGLGAGAVAAALWLAMILTAGSP